MTRSANKRHFYLTSTDDMHTKQIKGVFLASLFVAAVGCATVDAPKGIPFSYSSMKGTPVCYYGITSAEENVYTSDVNAAFRDRLIMYWPAFNLVEGKDCPDIGVYHLTVVAEPRKFEFKKFSHEDDEGDLLDTYFSSASSDMVATLTDRNGVDVWKWQDHISASRKMVHHVESEPDLRDMVMTSLILFPLSVLLPEAPEPLVKIPESEPLNEYGVSAKYPPPPDGLQMSTEAANKIGQHLPAPDCPEEGLWRCFLHMMTTGI